MAEKKRLLFIYNTFAGRGQIAAKLSDIIDIFVQEGYEVTVHPTQKYHDAMKTVEAMEDGYELVVASGGDGTLDEVVSGMMMREHRIPIGYIPAGSTNDFGSSLKIPLHLQDAAYTAVTGYPFRCDVGGFADKYFIYIAAFGMFTDVSYDTPQEMKNTLGHLAYVLEGVKRLSSIRSYHMTVTYDDQEISGEFIYGMVTNSRSVAGVRNMVNKQETVFDDGLFEVTLIRRPQNVIELNEIASALMIQQIDSPNMVSFKAAEVTFRAREDIAWTLDGEFGGYHEEITIKNLSREVMIMLPKEQLEHVSMYTKEELEQADAGSMGADK